MLNSNRKAFQSDAQKSKQFKRKLNKAIAKKLAFKLNDKGDKDE